MSSRDTQIQKGREALIIFHNESLKYPEYKLKFDEMLNQVSKKNPTIFCEGMGFAIENMDSGWFLSSSKVSDAMKKFASRAKGKLPSTMTPFFTALTNESAQVTWVDATGYAAVETAKTVGKGVMEVGDITLDTLKSVGMFLPLAILLGAGFIFYSKVRQIAK